MRYSFFLLVFLQLAYAASPTVTSVAETSATEDSAYSYSVTATDTDANDSLTWSAKSGTTLPSWLSLSEGSTHATEIATGISSPGGMAIDAGGNVYVAELVGDTIHKIDAQNNLTSFATVSASRKYAMLVVDDYLYISYYTANKITRIALDDPDSGESDWVTGLPNNGPLGMVEKDGYLYVATNYGGHVVKKINMTTLAVTDETVAWYIFGVDFMSDGNLLMASYTNRRLDLFDGSSVTNDVYTETDHMTDVRVDNNDNIYVCTNGGGMVKLNSDFTFSANIGSTTDSIWGMSISDSGTLVWGSSSTGNIYKLETGAVLSGTPSNDDVGTHDVSLTVSDESNDVDHIFQITVTNTNDAPVLAASSNLAYTENDSASSLDSGITLSDVDADAVGISANITISTNFISSEDTLAFTDANGITGSWDSSEGVLELSGNASVSNYQSALRSVTYVNSSDNPSGNVRTIAWETYDGHTTSNTVSTNIVVTAVNDAPSITSATVTSGVSGIAYSYTPSATDAESDTLTWSLTSGPTGMSINSSTGELSWTPTVGTNSGSEAVTISVSDGSLSDSQTFTITSTGFNEAPVITEGSSTSVTMSEDGSPNPFSLSLNATDVNKDNLIWNITSQANSGVASASDTGSYPTITYTPQANFYGNDSFVAQVSDGTETDSITVNVNVTAVNDAPIISPSTNLTVTTLEDLSLSLSSANLQVSDVDGDPLVWSISANASQGNVTTLTQSDNQIGLLEVLPNADFYGSDNLLLTVSDDNGASDHIWIELDISSVNDAPEVTDPNALSFNVQEDKAFAAFAIAAKDTEMDELTWSFVTAPELGSLSLSDPADIASLTYSPNPNQHGKDSFTLALSDGLASQNVEVTMNIAAVNDAPSVTTPALQQLAVGDSLNLSIDAEDVDGDTIFLRSTGGGRSWMHLSPSDLSITGKVPSYEAGQLLALELGVSDGMVTQSVLVQIQVEDEDPPATAPEPLDSATTTITVVGSNGQAIESAQVDVPGQQLRYSDVNGRVSLNLPLGLSTELTVSAATFQSQTISLGGAEGDVSVTLASADLLLQGTVSLPDSQPPLGVKVVAHSSRGVYETHSDGDGSYKLYLEAGATTWTVGASHSGYSDNVIELVTQASDSVITRDFQLSMQTTFSWRSHQSSDGEPGTIWVSSKPSFQPGDETTAIITTNSGSVGPVSFNESGEALSFTYSPAAGATEASLDFSATPVSGVESELSIDLNLSSEGGAEQNLHFFQHVSNIAGSEGEIALAGMDSDEEDLSGVEIPPFGVSSNVQAIKMERVEGKLSPDRLGATVYNIEAYSIDDAGVYRVAGNDEIEQIYLTFSFDPALWSPTLHHIIYSEDQGTTWIRVERSDIVSIDTDRNTVTLKTKHLSLWSLSSNGGLQGLSGDPNSSGGGCLLK